jgi:multiple sugar transport system permease protein
MSVLILIMILPVMLLTLTLQRFIVKGILVGAVKG